VKAVLFDIDNTLLMKSPGIPEKWQQILHNSGIEVPLADAQRALAECEMWVGEQTRRENENGVRMSDEEFLDGVMSCCIHSLGVPTRFKVVLADVWAGRYEIEYKIAPGAIETLDALRARGIPLGIVSNNRSSIRRVLAEMKLAEYFQTIVISEEVNLFKPDPRILEYACAKLEIDCADVVYAGDHPFDVVCAHAAKVQAAWIPANEFVRLPDYADEPEYRLRILSDLLKKA